MAILQFPAFTPPAFDYQRFRAAFVRRKRMTVYERVKEDALRTHHARVRAQETVNGIPAWAWYQQNVGIYNTMRIWKAEVYAEPVGRESLQRPRWRRTDGLLMRVKAYQIEPMAIANIESQSAVWLTARGRTWLDQEEHRAWMLEREYMTRCDTLAFKARNSGFEPFYYRDGSLGENAVHKWIGKMMSRSHLYVEDLLARVSAVYALHAQLGMTGSPEVRVTAVRGVGLRRAG